MKTVTHNWNWWAYQFRVIHLNGVPGIDAWNDSVVAFLRFAMGLRPGEHLLDLACGSGPHALRLARQGFHVTGLDIAPSLAVYCREQAGREGLTDQARFCIGDMRTLPFESAFDAGYLYSGSFGFFGLPDDQCVLAGIARALRPGGRFVVDCLDPEHAGQQIGLLREERPEGIYEMETHYDPATATVTTEFRFTDRAGVVHLSDVLETLRLYDLPELRAMCAAAGLKVTAVYGTDQPPYRPYGPDCHRAMLLVLERVGRA